VGIYPDARSAIAIACRPDAPIEPELANHDRYTTLYEHYRTVVTSATLHGGADAASTGAPRSNRNAGERP
jgi:hypothetical protein